MTARPVACSTPDAPTHRTPTCVRMTPSIPGLPSSGNDRQRPALRAGDRIDGPDRRLGPRRRPADRRDVREDLLRAPQGDGRPDPTARTTARRGAVPGPLPARVGARPREDAGRRDPGRRGRWHVRPHPVHARPAALRHHRHPHLPREQRNLRRRVRAGVRQLPAHRRDQPGARPRCSRHCSR